MTAKFSIEYHTRWGQEICVSINDVVYSMNTTNGLNWHLETDVSGKENTYQYQIRLGESVEKEFGERRNLVIDGTERLYIKDSWRSCDTYENVLYSAPFIKSFFTRKAEKPRKSKDANLIIGLRHIKIDPDQKVGILGDIKELGSWDPDQVKILDSGQFPFWSTQLKIAPDQSFEYKYVLCDANGKLLKWEEGNNRTFSSEVGFKKAMINDEYASFDQDLWRGAGVALPVFSLRTENSGGVGEFTDIPVMIDWMAEVGFKVFQVLPVNDTVASHTWWDSYPYAAISVHALHPVYGNMKAVGSLKNEEAWKHICDQAEKLNQGKDFEYEAVMKMKSNFYKLSYDENKDQFLKSSEFKTFLKANEHWIYDYAVFSCLRDRNKTPDFHQWGKHRMMTDEEVRKFASPKAKHYDDVAVHFYIQYHLDKQLKAATEYGRKKSVILKGDIPIGIFRNSVEAWRKPDLFQLDQQAGAPPDMFSDTGQNWGFPTYNWPEMEKNGYQWWTDRLRLMSKYFDMIRLDHILGFFRIWQMPADQVQGLLGIFYPSLPLSAEEIRKWGIHLDIEQYCDPLIHDQQLESMSFTELIEDYFLVKVAHGWEFRDAMLSQQVVTEKIRLMVRNEEISQDIAEPLRKEVFRLHGEVLFVRDEKEGYYHPRIDLHHTFRYFKLDESLRHRIRVLHDYYFHHRHNQFWKENANKKLPILRDASDMLMCGEDLGFVPASVGPLMNELQILQLNVQRFPEYREQFWELHYLSVKGPGNHDMHTLRQWWKHDPDGLRRFYHGILGRHGEPPDHMDDQFAEKLLKLQFEANSMWVIIPLQDLIILDHSMLRENPEEERINVPENPKNVWKYRFHMNIGELNDKKEFNQKVRELIKGSKRG